jgi:opacity protein-like surface antigen
VKRIIAALVVLALLATSVGAAITVVADKPQHWGTKLVVFATLALDSSYRNGGETLTPANLGLTNIKHIDLTCDLAGYLLQYDYSAQKVVVYADAESTAVKVNEYIPFSDVAPDTNAVDLSGVTGIRIFAIGN